MTAFGGQRTRPRPTGERGRCRPLRGRADSLARPGPSADERKPAAHVRRRCGRVAEEAIRRSGACRPPRGEGKTRKGSGDGKRGLQGGPALAGAGRGRPDPWSADDPHPAGSPAAAAPSPAAASSVIHPDSISAVHPEPDIQRVCRTPASSAPELKPPVHESRHFHTSVGRVAGCDSEGRRQSARERQKEGAGQREGERNRSRVWVLGSMERGGRGERDEVPVA